MSDILRQQIDITFVIGVILSLKQETKIIENVDNKLVIFSDLSINVLEYNVYGHPNFGRRKEENPPNTKIKNNKKQTKTTPNKQTKTKTKTNIKKNNTYTCIPIYI